MSRVVTTVAVQAAHGDSICISDLRRFLARWDELRAEQAETGQDQPVWFDRLTLQAGGRLAWKISADLPDGMP